MSWGNVGIEEVAWLLAALPGLYLWAQNYRSARRTRRAAQIKNVGNGRLLWAKYSTMATATHTVIESVFVLLGVVAIFRPANPGSTEFGRLVIGAALIGCSLLLTLLALMWKQIEEDLIGLVARRNTQRVTLEDREKAADVRGTAQNVRTVAQDVRGTAQDVRTVAQDVRGTAQDDRSRSQAARGVAQDQRGEDLDARSQEIEDRSNPSQGDR